MTEPMGWRLIEDWRNGTISEENFASLQVLLREEPDARRTLRRSMTMDTALRDQAEAQLLGVEANTVVVDKQANKAGTPSRPRWFSSAALLVVGVFAGCVFSSAVWAFTQSRSPESFVVPVAIVNGGFEAEETPSAFGYPMETGVWTGDQVEVVESGHQGVPSFEGKRMLRLKQTWGETPEKRSVRANRWQIVDLRDVDRSKGITMATLRAQFNRIDAGSDTDTSFFLQIYAFEGNPSTAEAQRDRDTFISQARLFRRTDSDPRTWEKIEISTSVPPEADFLLIGFFAHENVHDNPPQELEFAGHYVDGIELNLTTLKPHR